MRRRFGIGTGSLPTLNFQPIVRPVRQAPIEQFKLTADELNRKYRESAERDDNMSVAMAELQASPLAKDQELYQQMKNEFAANIDRRAEAGNYEDMVRATQKDARDFMVRSAPLRQRKATVDEFRKQVFDNPNINAKAKRQIWDKFLEEENAKDFEYDDRGNLINTLDTGVYQDLLAKDVDVTQYLDQLGSGFFKDIEDLGITVFTNKDGLPIFKQANRGVISKEEVDKVFEQAIMSNPDIAAFVNRQERLGDPVNFDELKKAMVDKFAGTEDRASYQVLTGLMNNGSGSGNDRSESPIIIEQDSASVQINSSNDIRDIKSTISRLKNEGREEDAKNLEAVYNSYNEQFKQKALKSGSLNEKELELYNTFSDYNYGDTNLDDIGNISYVFENRFGQTKEEWNKLKSVYQELDRKQQGNTSIRENDDNNIIKNIRDVLLKADKAYNDLSKDVTPLARTYTTFGGLDEGYGQGELGNYNQALNENADISNYSMIESFTTNNGKSFDSFLKENYIDNDEYSDYKNFTTKLAAQNGISLDGNPMSTIAVFGVLDDGTKVRLNEHNVTDGERGWTNRRRAGQALLKDGNAKGLVMINQTLPLPNGKKVGQVIAQNNIYSIPVGKERDINLGNNKKFRAIRVGENDIKIMGLNGKPLKDQNENTINFFGKDDLLINHIGKLIQSGQI